jgi:phage terminase large subunit-like protein
VIDPAKLKDLLETLEAVNDRQTYRKLDYYKPYPKQKTFHDLGAHKRERLLMAGNQQGKTYSAAAEVAMHMTGEYPEYWEGRRFNKATSGWIAGESAVLVRDGPQKLLCGKPGVDSLFGTGLIPKAAFSGKPSLSRGVTDAYDTIQVTHKTNGIEDGVSTATFKSYEQGREKFQSETLDWIWNDEECPEDIYQEELARITATNGMIFMTFTPLKGRTEVVIRYMDEISIDRAVVNMTIEDALHITPEQRDIIIRGYPKHQRDARIRGIPLLGSGVIFTEPEENVFEVPIHPVPTHWAKLWGIDFGIGHPFAAVLLLWDRDTDVVHIHHTIRMTDALPINHASAMRVLGADVPVAWPQDGTSREKGSGQALSTMYKREGLRMLPEHATWPDGGYSTEAAIEEMLSRERNGKLKVSMTCRDYMEERRFYHRKEGKIVHLKDDILSATQKALMMLRHAKPVLLGSKRPDKRQYGNKARGIDFNLFGDT